MREEGGGRREAGVQGRREEVGRGRSTNGGRWCVVSNALGGVVVRRRIGNRGGN